MNIQGTQVCKAYKFDYKGTTVHLIDTPGFDDTRKSDTDVLKDIAGWLLVAYRDNIRLSGMVYLHSISETRMKGSHMTNLRMFQKLAGLKNMGHVILTTTMCVIYPLMLRPSSILLIRKFYTESTF